MVEPNVQSILNFQVSLSVRVNYCIKFGKKALENVTSLSNSIPVAAYLMKGLKPCEKINSDFMFEV